VHAIFDSESALELNAEVVTLTPGTSCVQLFRAQPEDGSIRGAETRCCYKWFNYVVFAIT